MLWAYFQFQSVPDNVHVFIPETQVHPPQKKHPAMVEIADIGDICTSHTWQYLAMFSTCFWMFCGMINKNNSTITCKTFSFIHTCITAFYFVKSQVFQLCKLFEVDILSRYNEYSYFQLKKAQFWLKC